MTPSANILQPIIDVFDAVLVFFHDTVGLQWGMSIIALTVVVRALLIPLTLKQFKSMQSLQQLAPEIKQLQEKYKDDKQRLNQEMMRFYQENKVNPFGSCLPLVAAAPGLLLAVLHAPQGPAARHLRADRRSRAAREPCGQGDRARRFLFIPDITDKATGAVLVVLLVLYIGSQLLSSVLMSVTADRNQRMLMIGAAVRLRALHHRLPGGPDPLLDHDEPLDRRPADVHPAQGGDARRVPQPAGTDATGPARKGRDRDRDGKGERWPSAASATRTARAADGAPTGRRRRSAASGRPAAPAAAQEEETGRRR